VRARPSEASTYFLCGIVEVRHVIRDASQARPLTLLINWQQQARSRALIIYKYAVRPAFFGALHNTRHTHYTTHKQRGQQSKVAAP
jgi:hypothetical protein